MTDRTIREQLEDSHSDAVRLSFEIGRLSYERDELRELVRSAALNLCPDWSQYSEWLARARGALGELEGGPELGPGGRAS